MSKQLDALENFLLSLPSGDDGMLLSEFDGLIAGIVVCPEVILPNEWLPLVWGAGEPAFVGEKEAKAALDLIMGHYNQVARDLAHDIPQYSAVIDEIPATGEVMWECWVSGFEMAMGLRPESWQGIVESNDGEASSAVLLLLTLAEINNGTCDLDKAAIEELTQTAPNIIPSLVVEINRWTKQRSGAQSSTGLFSGLRVGPKIGRNQVCPCGSGKKYKKCCGAVTFH